MYLFCNFLQVDFFKQELEKYFKLLNMIIWVKNNHTAGDLTYSFGRQYEIIFLVSKGKKPFNDKRLTDVWFFNRVSSKNQLHQNQKPLELIEQCLLKHSNETDVVFDGFAGSSTTGVASQNLNRKYILVEKDDYYLNISKQRLIQNLS